MVRRPGLRDDGFGYLGSGSVPRTYKGCPVPLCSVGFRAKRSDQDAEPYSVYLV